MDISPIKAVQAPYQGDNFYRTPPPDLPSLLLKERIVYLGAPLVPEVTKLIIAELLYLQSDDPDKPIKIYINSIGTSFGDQPIAFETEAFAIYDTMRYIKPPIHTICIGQAMGMAAMLLGAGTKGCRAALPHASIVLRQPISSSRGQATDIKIMANEVFVNKQAMIDILSRCTEQTKEKIHKDMDRMFYMTPQQAVEYGLIDRVFNSKAELDQSIVSAGIL
ncbi:MAG: ATP-dependent Clp protease proteolytic subunit [Calothrix sp. MO_192.B10]|nr:ATP-dependent Clp protease proteolytic subunit [Calothrix sp. MO_192.B10]